MADCHGHASVPASVGDRYLQLHPRMDAATDLHFAGALECVCHPAPWLLQTQVEGVSRAVGQDVMGNAVLVRENDFVAGLDRDFRFRERLVLLNNRSLRGVSGDRTASDPNHYCNTKWLHLLTPSYACADGITMQLNKIASC